MNRFFGIDTVKGPALLFDIQNKMDYEEKVRVFDALEHCILNKIIVVLHAGNGSIWNSFASKVKEIAEREDIDYYRSDYSNRSGFRIDYAQ